MAHWLLCYKVHPFTFSTAMLVHSPSRQAEREYPQVHQTHFASESRRQHLILKEGNCPRLRCVESARVGNNEFKQPKTKEEIPHRDICICTMGIYRIVLDNANAFCGLFTTEDAGEFKPVPVNCRPEVGPLTSFNALDKPSAFQLVIGKQVPHLLYCLMC